MTHTLESLLTVMSVAYVNATVCIGCHPSTNTQNKSYANVLIFVNQGR